MQLVFGEIFMIGGERDLSVQSRVVGSDGQAQLFFGQEFERRVGVQERLEEVFRILIWSCHFKNSID